ncbi:ORF169 [Leucania separata nucleopolyhedrovirus]|uniref:ORF169 n=1 Tax=Leucania separata nucleopolyhedrovirus TaxID=1307956 RepID=Q0IKV0_NPVLS|nr:ORF169 [Leucania separata nucleopolyhedrovirus]AAR28933.1 ORF169 [Leucania separata nucleopolyhedrovirus]
MSVYNEPFRLGPTINELFESGTMDGMHKAFVNFKPPIRSLRRESIARHTDMILSKDFDWMMHCHPVFPSFHVSIFSFAYYQRFMSEALLTEYLKKLENIKPSATAMDELENEKRIKNMSMDFLTAMETFQKQRKLIRRFAITAKFGNFVRMVEIVNELLQPFRMQVIAPLKPEKSAHRHIVVTTTVIEIKFVNQPDNEPDEHHWVEASIEYNYRSNELSVHLPEFTCNEKFWMQYTRDKGLTTRNVTDKYFAYGNMLMDTFETSPVIHSYRRRFHRDILTFDILTRTCNTHVPLEKFDNEEYNVAAPERPKKHARMMFLKKNKNRRFKSFGLL